MTLGDLLSAAERAAGNGDVAALLDSPSLLAGVAAAAANEGTDPDSYVALAVRRFERDASPDDWVSLMGAASREADPGKACLQRMVQWALSRPGTGPG